jgi:hypothetical protein
MAATLEDLIQPMPAQEYFLPPGDGEFDKPCIGINRDWELWLKVAERRRSHELPLPVW